MRQHFLFTIVSMLFAVYAAQELLEQCKDVSGQRHKIGDSYIGEDGCNTCHCLEAGSACSKRFCPKNDAETPIGRDTAYKCVDDQGNPHRVGDKYTHVDGCNTCTCLEAGGACTRKYCIKEPKSLGCFDNKGNIMTESNGTYIGPDDCNDCICGVLGPICTEMLCTLSKTRIDEESQAEVEEFSSSSKTESLGNKSCMDADNKTRNAGTKWLSQDSCNICWCAGDGNGPVCTKMTCPQRFERLVRSGASISIVSIASVFAVTLMIVTL